MFYSSISLPIGGAGPLDHQKKEGLRNEKPAVLDKIGIDENLGGEIDLDLEFLDENGEAVQLAKYFGDKPVLMLLVYYECPTLCNLQLNALVETMRRMKMKPGEEFELVAISIDAGESPRLAKKKLDAYLKSYGKEDTRDGWHFLTGTEENIKAISSQVGFNFAWDQNMEQWAHSAASYVLTPQGKLSFYHYGLKTSPKVLRLSLVEASANKIGNVVDRLVLYCLQYDPTKKTYSFYAFNLMKAAVVITMILVIVFLGFFWRKEYKKSKNIEKDKGTDL